MKRIACRFIVGLLVLLLLGGAWLVYEAFFHPILLPEKTLLVKVNLKTDARDIAFQLKAQNVPIQPMVFIGLSRLFTLQSQLKAGYYRIESGVSTYQILEQLAKGQVEQKSLTVIEGWTIAQMRALINQQPNMQIEAGKLSASALLQAIGASQADIQRGHLEGLFFPNTYFYVVGGDDLAIYQRAYQLMQKSLQTVWQARDQDLPYQNAYQLLIMASLIEKETGFAQDRAMVAGVFVNRLKRHMPLQSDPTVIYALGHHFDGTLTRRDLSVNSPYNTYRYDGLPPTPIALPSYASLYAAAHPEKSSALYFVAKGNGESDFNDTLHEHNRAVRKYLRKAK